jgi:hypothetical protein
VLSQLLSASSSGYNLLMAATTALEKGDEATDMPLMVPIDRLKLPSRPIGRASALLMEAEEPESGLKLWRMSPSVAAAEASSKARKLENDGPFPIRAALPSTPTALAAELVPSSDHGFSPRFRQHSQSYLMLQSRQLLDPVAF